MKYLICLAIVGGLASIAPVMFAQTSSSEGQPAVAPAIAVSPPRLEIGVNPGAGAVESKLSVTNLGPANQVVSAALGDLLVTKSGAYEALPPAQTPYSVAQVGFLSQETVELAPAGSGSATREVRLTVQLPEQAQPLYGAIVVKPAAAEPPPPAAPSGAGSARVAVKVTTAILVPVVLVPLGAAGRTDLLAPSVHLGIQPVSLELRQARPNGWLDAVIPVSLPKVADHGPLLATVTVRNTGDAFSRAFTHARFASVNLLSWLPAALKDRLGIRNTVFLEADLAPGAAMPGDTTETAAVTEITNQGNRFDTAPIVGLVHVQTQTRMVLADAGTDPARQDAWILVLPWKELCTIALLFAAASWARARWRWPAPVARACAPLPRPRHPDEPVEAQRHEQPVEDGQESRPAAALDDLRHEDTVQPEPLAEETRDGDASRDTRRDRGV